ncbi:U3 small nucleolar RNA-associated protein 6 [Apiospora phragmitis]|uniref:U3 small nucleolar RNA-associated protein 6 n=1 Tax=Apiospora phragmitis TaxID=2905665 RepID=A0ABR1SX20_9PEZI
MAAVADKARYYLEQSVPQLRDFEAKNIFSQAEIRNLVRKREDFEHRVLSPGCKPADYLAYVAWERSLEKLRAKRCARLRIRQSTSHAGEGRIFGILERAIARHPGSLELWKEYLMFAKDIRATKRWRRVITRALRMHPAKSELWVLAGKRAADNNDMSAARNFFMRGARFCTKDSMVWIEYARCEMQWLEKMEARKNKKGGVSRAIAEQAENDDDQIHFDEDSEDDADENGHLTVPNPDGQAKKVFDNSTAEKLEEKNPALDGAIPMAIFDVAKKQPFFNAAAGEQFFDVFGEFPAVSSQPKIAQHVLDTMSELYPHSPAACNCFIRQPVLGVSIDSAAYPQALREALSRLKSSLTSTSDKIQLARKTLAWMEPVLASESLDSGLRTVLEYTVQTLPKP